MRMPSVYKAFTLLELSICVAIIGLLSIILIARYPDSAVRIKLVNLNHTLALLVREAQLRGSSVDSANGTISGYGLYIKMNEPDKIVLYGDLVGQNVTTGNSTINGLSIGNRTYDISPLNETKSTTFLPRGFTVSALCVLSSRGNTYICFNDPSAKIDINFTRPSLVPHVIFSADTYTGTPLVSKFCVQLSSQKAGSAYYSRSLTLINSVIVTSNKPCM